MILTIKNARFEQALNLRSGEYNGQPWSIQDFIFTIDENFSNASHLMVTGKNDGIYDLQNLRPGQVVNLAVYPVSRQNKNGYWNTNLMVYKVEAPTPVQPAAPAAPATPAPRAPQASLFNNHAPAAPSPAVPAKEEDDDLPF